MERVALLLEETGEQIRCLLNPDSLVMRRLAGVRARRSLYAPSPHGAHSDDPLLSTGGGTTELTLDLLFDTSLAGSSIQSGNVRDLTLPLSRLTENTSTSPGATGPPVVRLIWGKTWNIPGVVVAVSERFEYFDPSGAPQRSWLRMKMVRVSERAPEPGELPQGLPPSVTADSIPEAADETEGVHEVVGGSPSLTGLPAATLPMIASLHFSSSAFWRVIAWGNRIADPLRLTPGTLLRIPSIPGARR